MTKTLFSIFVLLCCGLLAKANNTITGSPAIALDISISFKNDYQDTYHLALIIYTPDGKNQTRVSNLKPNQIKSYSFPIGSEIYIADWKQEEYAMKGNDLKSLGVAPLITLTKEKDKIKIDLSSISINGRKFSAENLAGIWQFELGNNDIVQRVILAHKYDSLCGIFFGQSFCGNIVNDKFSFSVSDFMYNGTIKEGGIIEGTFVDKNGTVAKWRGLRETNLRKPQTYLFNPQIFHRDYSSFEKPVLRLVPGDVVNTSTIDASGTDKNSNKVTWGGNPLTGPFYVENSMPGDVIAVKIISVKTNRGWAFSGRTIIESALESDYLTNRKNERIDNAWLINTDSGYIRMAEPSKGLRNYKIPLTPFLGCVGVAPSLGTGISSKESGRFGGNMEEKTVTTGTTLYLPVFVQGAYLYFGDGHAAQGDGELTGSAMETSMDVSFSVELLKGKSYNTPRIETKNFIKSVGVSGTLDQAMKIATTDLTKWLERDFNLTEAEAAMVMGFSVEYEIPDLVGSSISVTAKIDKSVIDSLTSK